ncbi:septum site-determining protein MinC [Legionella oakridgensis]|uniref:septum site-determining protein MinC n=1 Tax=Legionella oakridgensis TaxID=29423 RepID=UPI0003DE1243|nr:septum site-determining protein MinC [Legionella oakridgensis]ETO93278.1 septum site-determining protein MinC [Legionella oakridgensis RV-2-2007]
MADKILKSQAFKLKGRLYTLTVLSILDTDRVLFSQQLAEIVLQAPRLFKQTPVVLDCSAIDSSQLDLQAFCQVAREHGLIPVAVQGGNAMLDTLAQCQGLAVVHASSSHDKLLLDNHQEETSVTEIIKTKLITTPVRSGQQVVTAGDLIVTAAVSHGAELLADGNIHVYGALRGRALAGIDGNKQARIFCQSLEAELVSIAGYYRLSDAIELLSKPCQIYLQDDHIQIELL